MDPKTLFVIAITTAKMLMPGMPTMKLPGMPDMSAPTRTMTMDLTSPKKADAKSTAECAVPEGLKIGPKAVLDIDLPVKAVEGTPGAPGGADSGKIPEFTMKLYWTSSQPVPEGQPRVISSAAMNADVRAALDKNPTSRNKFMRVAGGGMDGSHAYWPGKGAKKITKESACPGPYTLTTNYCGGTSITLDKPQNFLAPIDITSPGKDVDLSSYITVTWKSVRDALAYVVNAFAGKDKLMVSWTSSSKPDAKVNVLSSAITKEQLGKLIADGTLLGPDKTTVYIPIAIFQEVGAPFLTITAIGADRIQTKDGIETQVVVRSNGTMMLGLGVPAGVGSPGEEEQQLTPKTKDKPTSDDDPPAANSGDALDKTQDTVDKASNKKDQVGDIINKTRNIFKRR